MFPAISPPKLVVWMTLDIREWLIDQREKQKLRQDEVDQRSRDMGARISQSYLSQLERGVKPLSSLGPDRMDVLRRIYGISLEEWVKQTGLSIVTPTDLRMSDDVRSSTRVRVPVYALAAAGKGDWTEEDIITYIDVEPEIASRPNRVTFQVDGTSMEPTLDHGDYIHIDLADKDIRDDKVYVVLILSNGIVVKRARVYEGGTIELVSDNKSHPSVRPDEARIIGRVFAVTPRTRRL